MRIGILPRILAAAMAACVIAFPARATVDDEIAELKAEIRKLQERVEALEAKRAEERAAAQVPADRDIQVGHGTIKFEGQLQQWYIHDAGGADTFRTRRAAITLSGEATPKVAWRLKFDLAKNPSLRVTTDPETGAVTGVSLDKTKGNLQDLVLTYRVGEKTFVDLGQFKMPFSFEGLQSSGKLDTIERSMLSTEGDLGATRDVGVQFRREFPGAELRLGLFQGEGQNNSDDDDQKDLVARLNIKPSGMPGLQFGGSFYAGRDGVAQTDRRRWGTHLDYRRAGFIAKAEYARGEDENITRAGWYGLAGYSISPAWEGVVRYERYDPDRAASGDRLSAWTFGVNHYIAGHNAKIQVNYVRLRPEGGPSRDLLMSNFQVLY